MAEDKPRDKSKGKGTISIQMPTPKAPQRREACLLGVAGRTKGRRVPFSGAFEIGSSERCGLYVDDVGVSRRHARIGWKGLHPTIEDLGSTNGTFVNGEQIDGRRRLAHDDEIQVGYATFRFQNVDDAAAALYDELYQRATRDPLTALYNRHHLRSEFERDLDRCVRVNQSMSVLLLDIDHFKTFNDTWGHAAGDAALVVVAQRILACVREGDVVGRWGGEEFLVLLPHTPIEGAMVVAERLLDRIAADPVELDSENVPVTVSIGVADSIGLGIGPHPYGASRDEIVRAMETLIQAADEQLYAAKHAGRNCVRRIDG